MVRSTSVPLLRRFLLTFHFPLGKTLSRGRTSVRRVFTPRPGRVIVDAGRLSHTRKHQLIVIQRFRFLGSLPEELRNGTTMDSITDVRITDCNDSNYVKPLRLHFKQTGIEKSWDVIKTADSVCVLLFNPIREVLLFVRQFRPVVYMNRSKTYEEDGVRKIDTTKYSGDLGITTELCAGIVDKNISLQEVAQEEIYEECGYKVPLDNIERVVSYRQGVGTTGALTTFFYAEITDKMKVGKGGGIREEGEMIDVLEIPAKEVKALVMDESVPKPSGLMFAIYWFLDTKWKK